MKPVIAGIAVIAALSAGAVAFAVPAAAEERIITIGTAGVTGVYYPAGGAICRLVNRGRREHGVRCTVESTGGSINNLEAVRKGEIELGVVQSDLLFHAYKGDEVFADVGADRKLRVIFSLHPEPFTVIARQDARINTFDDLKGKRVHIGAPGSGMRATMEELMIRKGWTEKTFAGIVDVRADEQANALCSGVIDALVYAGGHPNGAVQQITSACATKLVDVSGSAIDMMIKEQPFYAYAIIPGGMYVGNERDTRTFGVKAVLVASEDLSEEIVYQVVRAVFENLDNFKTLHPVFAALEAPHMALDTDIAPLHAGAVKYYKEKGLLPRD